MLIKMFRLYNWLPEATMITKRSSQLLKKIYVLSWLIISYLIVIILLPSCDLTEQQYFASQKLDYAEEQSDSVTIYEINGEHIERLITARKIERFYNDQYLRANEVNITDYNLDKTIRMTLYADSLIIDETQNTYEAKYNVVINHQNALLYTDLLNWDQNHDEIYAPDEVIIVRGNNVLRGFELRTDVDFNRIELSRVTAEGHLDDEDFADLDW